MPCPNKDQLLAVKSFVNPKKRTNLLMMDIVPEATIMKAYLSHNNFQALVGLVESSGQSASGIYN